MDILNTKHLNYTQFQMNLFIYFCMCVCMCVLWFPAVMYLSEMAQNTVNSFFTWM